MSKVQKPEAHKWAQFLKDEYRVETEIYTKYDYMKLPLEKLTEFAMFQI